MSENAAASDPASIVFTPLTDNVSALSVSAVPSPVDPSISIGAVSVQPGGTGVILAGTGDPNDALDSYYGAGILRSTDGGTTWSVIQITTDLRWSFVGEGFAGFAWSTLNPQLVVAAVSQAWEGVTVAADRPNLSYEGLYYSTDSGATWSLARISDQNGMDVQGPDDAYTSPDGNAATSVVWNPVRNLFIAAVRLHGYYQSSDGVNWTRLAFQPGSGLTTALCPTNPTMPGSTGCPIFRGTLAVNPQTGDTFAWTVDQDDQDQGIWQDVCSASGGSCSNPTITFARQWNSAPLEANTWLGGATIFNGDYNLALAAVPSGQDTILLAGGNDLWKCSLAMGCSWRNTTNAFSCMSGQVGGYQHAIAWNPSGPLELFFGNDGGLWRSTDAVGQTGPVCAATDAGHFQNLNGGLGSLAEVESMSPLGASPYTMMVGLGADGTAGSSSTAGTTLDWPQILDGEGGPVAVDPSNASNWYVNNGAGVSIHLCSKAPACTAADFGVNPVVSSSQVGGDGLTMSAPAPFLVDPADPTQLLIGTCRLWRGPASGIGWTSANAVSPMFDGDRAGPSCSGNALVRSLAALPLKGGGEVVYVGMYGSKNGGATLPGHVLSATLSAGGTWSAWQDLTNLNPVTNNQLGFNHYGFDVSSLFIDPHDPAGNTVYVTIAGMPNPVQAVTTLYRSVDGGVHWTDIRTNLPAAPANSLVIDPQDPNTAYIATDTGVYFTRTMSNCANLPSSCWTAYGTRLPEAPVVALGAAPATTSPNVLVAATYGRGVWQIPLATAGVQLTTATAQPASLLFAAQNYGTPSAAQTVTLTNTGSIALVPGTIAMTGDFSETDNCGSATLNFGSSCAIQVTFDPTTAGARTGQLTIAVNISGGVLTVPLSGTGNPPGLVNLSPASMNFGQVQVGSLSPPLPITVQNGGSSAVSITSLTVSGPFLLASNSCGTTSVAADSDCQLTVEFQPAARGAATGSLKMVDSSGTQVVQLAGSGEAPPTDALSPTSLTFAATVIGQSSAPQTIALTNSGDVILTSIKASVSGPFQLTSNCTAQLPGNTACSLSVTFIPTQAATQTGTLTVSDILNPGQTVALSGTGVLPPTSSTVQIVPARVSFPATGVGVTSTPVILTIMNAAAGPALADIKLSVSSGFALSNSTCTATLAAGANCTTGVSFTPPGAGAQAGTFTVSSSSLSGAVTAPLTGMGFDFQASAAGNSTQTVSSGQTASYSIAVVPAAGSSGTFSFQCGTLPAHAACAFNPLTVDVGANATGTAGLQVTTSQVQSGAAFPPLAGPWRVPSLAVSLAVLPLAWRRRRRYVWAGMAVFLGLGISSCSSSGGGSGGSSPPPTTTTTTPAGTYSIPVTVTANGVEHTVTLTLIVD